MRPAMISFLDGEVLYADVDDLSFDVPVLEARVRNVNSNSDHALFPLNAIRHVVIGGVGTAPADAELRKWERAVFRFLDGQVMRAQIGPRPSLGRHGGVWQCVEPGSSVLRRLGIPYAALKAVFEVHEWDGRPVAERGGPSAGAIADSERLERILNEREGGPVSSGENQALLNRVRRTGSSG